MPLYLVRWLMLAASLVRAEDEDELLPVTDAADEMRDEVLRGAFPELAEFIDGSTSEKRAQSRIRTRGRQNSNARSVRSSGRSSSTSARDVRSRRVTTSRRR